jgi:hypothetical protein
MPLPNERLAHVSGTDLTAPSRPVRQGAFQPKVDALRRGDFELFIKIVLPSYVIAAYANRHLPVALGICLLHMPSSGNFRHAWTFQITSPYQGAQICRDKFWIRYAGPPPGRDPLLLSLGVRAPPRSGKTEGAGRRRPEPKRPADSKEASWRCLRSLPSPSLVTHAEGSTPVRSRGSWLALAPCSPESGLSSLLYGDSPFQSAPREGALQSPVPHPCPDVRETVRNHGGKRAPRSTTAPDHST